MPGTLRITAEIAGGEAALAVAAELDELAGAVSAFEIREADALWRVDAYPHAPVLDAALQVRLALAATAAGGRLVGVHEERLAELLRMLPPAPTGWVEAAQELPLARPGLDRIVARAEADARFRELLLSDLESAFAQEGVEVGEATVEAVRRRLSLP